MNAPPLSPARSAIWSTLDFGKHAGRTLPQVLFADPDWFFWGFEQKIFRWFLAADAAVLNRRARSIRIPDPNHYGLVAEYAFEHDGRFAGLRIVSTRLQPNGCAQAQRIGAVDLSVPHEARIYDKSGYGILLSDLKEALFGDRRFRMTKRRCEEFYANAAHFTNP